MRSETHLREDAGSSSDEREREKEEWDRESDQAGQESPAQEDDVAALQMRSVIKTHTVPLNWFCGIVNMSNSLQEDRDSHHQS